MNASEVLRGVIDQFGSRVACLRELVQNAIDAGTNRIDVVFDRRDGFACISVQDYGCGMTRPDMEHYLLNVFESSKEDDLESIGKFGIGFVSIFALKPTWVTVETGKDGQHTRIAIDDTLGIRWFEGNPCAGTEVALFLKLGDVAFDELTREAVAFLEHSCGYVAVDLFVVVDNDARQISRELALESPIKTTLTEPGVDIHIGLSRHPHYTLMNHRLVLETQHRALVPGCSVLATSRDIEHNLARNAVVHNDGFARFMEQLHELARKQLLPQLLDRLETQERGAQTLELVAGLLGSLADLRLPYPFADVLKAVEIPLVRNGRESTTTLARVVSGGPDVRLVARSLDEASRIPDRVVHLSRPQWPIAVLFDAIGAKVSWVELDWFWAQPAAVGRLQPLISAAAEHLDSELVAATLHGLDPGLLAVPVSALDVAWPRHTPPAGPILALNSEHPLVRTLATTARHAPLQAAHLLLRGLAETGCGHDPADAALDSLLRSGTP
ncbi:MAG: hypothetical protein ACI9WU_001887 [Myxococcota bacterium]|jgi:hypothetical protein